jgi:hypothetical protein
VGGGGSVRYHVAEVDGISLCLWLLIALLRNVRKLSHRKVFLPTARMRCSVLAA